MAQQKESFHCTKQLKNITFYKSKEEFMVREKGSLNAKRIAHDPAFQKTSENEAE